MGFIVLCVFCIAFSCIVTFFLTIDINNKLKRELRQTRELSKQLKDNERELQEKLAAITTDLKYLKEKSGPVEEAVPEEETVEEAPPVPVKVEQPAKIVVDKVKVSAPPEPEKVVEEIKEEKPLEKPKPVITPVPAKPVKEKSKFTKAVENIESKTVTHLKKIWEWFLYGDIKEGVSKEYSMATNWLIRVGFLVLILSVGFFLRYSILHGWINNYGKTALGLLFGSALSVQGSRMLGKRYSLIGQGVLAVGLTSLYASFFAASNMYGIIPPEASFACMIMVTCGAGFISVQFNSKIVAILGMIGGYLTPILITTSASGLMSLYIYLTILGLGVLGVSMKKQWHLLNWLAMFGTYALFGKSMEGYNTDMFVMAIFFVTLYFCIFSITTLVYNLGKSQQSTLLEIFGIFANSITFFGFANFLIRGVAVKEFLAVVTIGLGIYYIILTSTCFKHKLKDRALILTFISLAGFFSTITMPILFSEQYLTVCWAVQAFIFLWLAKKLDSKFIRGIGYLVYMFVFVRLVVFEFPRFDYVKVGTTVFDYIPVLIGRLITFGVPVVSFFAGAKYLPEREKTQAVEKNLFKQYNPLVIVSSAVLFVFLHFELFQMFEIIYQPLQDPALTLIWAALCIWFIQKMDFDKAKFIIFLIGCMVAKLLLFDIQLHNINFFRLVYSGGYLLTHTLTRTLDFGIVIGTVYLGMNWFKKDKDGVVKKEWSTNFRIIAAVLLFVYSTFEVSTILRHFVHEARQGGISILWSVFALKFLIYGIKNNLRKERYCGLILFLVITLKVFMFDLAGLGQIYKIIAFFILGMAFFAGSFLYMKNQNKFSTKESEAS